MTTMKERIVIALLDSPAWERRNARAIYDFILNDLREPTDAMLKVGRHRGRHEALDIWHDMIDEARK